MTQCENCDAKLSNHFGRVYGDEDGNVYRCIHCVDPEKGGRSILRHGGAAIEDMNEVQRRMGSKKNPVQNNQTLLYFGLILQPVFRK